MPKGVYDHKPMAPEVRAQISATTKGRPKSPETRARMSAAKMGHAPSIAPWKDEVCYSGAHYRAKVALPMKCAHEDASCKGALDACFRWDAPKDLVRIEDRHGLLYYIGAVDDGYIRLCRSHHKRYDLSSANPRKRRD